MARADIKTLLPLDSWARIMGINPWEFNQVGEGFPTVNHAQCDHVWFQYQWQEDFLSREEIAGAISAAENMIATQLSYWPSPIGLSQNLAYPRPSRRNWVGHGATVQGKYKAVQLGFGKVISGGIYKRSEISAAEAITVSDPDGDGVNELFTLTTTTTVTDPDEIAIYFTAADRMGEAISELWRLRPVKVSISGGTVTITGHASMLVKPILANRTDAVILDVTEPTNFITEVEVHRVYIGNDTTLTEQGVAIWDDEGCESADCTNTEYAVCLYPRNGENGMVAVDYLLDGVCVDQEPDRLRINYISGLPLVDGQMDRQHAKMIAYLATALLPSGSCACDRSNRILAHWREVAPSAGEGLRTDLTGDLAMNPFGPQRGAVWAWQRVMEYRQQWGTII